MKQIITSVLAVTMLVSLSACGRAQLSNVGIEECDSFLDKYEQCIKANVPDAQSQVLLDALDLTRTQWQGIVEDPEDDTDLQVACIELTVNTAKAMQAYGCSF
jgi:hypothetical protein